MKNLSVFLLSFFCVFGYCQNIENLFLLMSYVDDFERDSFDNQNMQDYNKVLFNVNADTLIAFDTINIAANHSLNRLVQYSDQNCFYIEEKEFFNPSNPSFFSIIDYSSDSIIIKRYSSNSDHEFIGYSSYTECFYLDSVLWIKNQYKKRCNYKAINKNFESRLISISDYQNFYRSGTSSPFQYQPTFYYEYPFIALKNKKKKFDLSELYGKHKIEVGSALKITIGKHIKDYSNMQDSWIQIPQEYRDSTIGQIMTIVNNEDYYVGNGKSLIEGGINYFWVYDKNLSNMDSIKVLGNKQYVLKNYKDWLYGTVVIDKGVFQSNDSKRNWEKNQKLVSNNYNSENAEPPFLLDKTGQLLLIHIPTKKRIIWDTNSFDSEILLIEEDKIFYRVYDEIRCLDINNKTKEIEWQSETLIVKDKNIIPFVHHIFFSSTNQKKCKEVWVN